MIGVSWLDFPECSNWSRLESQRLFSSDGRKLKEKRRSQLEGIRLHSRALENGHENEDEGEGGDDGHGTNEGVVENPE